jgi:hypothetical protein
LSGVIAQSLRGALLGAQIDGAQIVSRSDLGQELLRVRAINQDARSQRFGFETLDPLRRTREWLY